MHSTEGKALCALLQIYEVGLSCNLREKSQQMTCVHAKATSRGITHLGRASSILESTGSPWAELILLTAPSPRPRVFPGDWARWVWSRWDQQRFTVRRTTWCLQNIPLIKQAQGFFRLEMPFHLSRSSSISNQVAALVRTWHCVCVCWGVYKADYLLLKAFYTFMLFRPWLDIGVQAA